MAFSVSYYSSIIGVNRKNTVDEVGVVGYSVGKRWVIKGGLIKAN